MDAWFSKAGALAQAAQQRAAELHNTATQLAEGVLQQIDVGGTPGSKDLEFEEGELGFEMEGVFVSEVEAGTQAARLGVEVGDRLVGVAGYYVPDFEPGDVDAEERAIKQIRKWLQEMPPPVRLTFMPLAPEVGGKQTSELSIPVPSIPEPVEVVEPPPPPAPAPEPAPAPAPTAEDLQQVAKQLGVDAGNLSEPDDGSKEIDEANHEVEEQEVSNRLPELKPAALQRSPQAEIADLLKPDEREQEDRRQLESGLQEARKAWAQIGVNLDAEKRKTVTLQKQIVDLQKQLLQARAEKKDMQLAASTHEISTSEEREAFETREKHLRAELAEKELAAKQEVEELTRRNVVAEADASALKQENTRLRKEVEELTAQTTAAEAKKSAMERQVKDLQRQLQGFQDAHEAELEILRDEHRGNVSLLEEKIDEQRRLVRQQEENVTKEKEKSRQAIAEAESKVAQHQAATEEARVDAQAAAVEATAARMEAAKAAKELQEAKTALSRASSQELFVEGIDGAEESDQSASRSIEPAASPSRSSAVSKEVQGLYDRIDVLERRCVTLQKKLGEKPQTSSSSIRGYGYDLEFGPGKQRPSWEPWLASATSPRIADLAVLLSSVPHALLRKFTYRLLTNDLWLWVFYVHLLLLYTVSASCFAQTTPDPSSPVDALNAQMAKASAAAAAQAVGQIRDAQVQAAVAARAVGGADAGGLDDAKRVG